MYEALLVILCQEAREDSLKYSEHHSLRLFQRRVPDKKEIEYLLCDDEPEVIESGKDERGRNHLIWGIMADGRVAHVLCSRPPSAKVITAYWPDMEPEEWSENYKRRIR
jgi:hypothetical protein